MGKGSFRFRVFRLSEVMPISWFYKLRDMATKGSRRSRKAQNSMEKSHVPIMETSISLENQKPSPKPAEKKAYMKNRPSYYIPSRKRAEKHHYFLTHPKATDTQLPLDKQRITKTKPHKMALSTHNKLIPSSVSSVSTCQEQSSFVLSSEPADETPQNNLNRVFELNTNDYNLPIPPPPIVTKPVKKETNKPNLDLGNQSSKQGSFSSHGKMRRSYTPLTPRIKMRLNSPKLAKKRLREKKGLSDSFVVVKLSSDPQNDFRESMLEMIFQNNLWASKDLEELLSCYLYLNSDEYHDLIVKAFKQIWFDLTVISLQYK